MRRRERPLDPEVAAGLAALDAALAGERPDPDIALIAEEARAWAPPMTPAFAAALDHAVEAGFPEAASRPKPRPAWGRWLPAAGLASAVLIALVVVVSTGGDSSENHATGAADAVATRATAPEAAAPEAKKDVAAAGGAAGSAGGGAAGSADLQSPSVQRRVERAA